MADQQNTPIDERRSRDFSIVFHLLFRLAVESIIVFLVLYGPVLLLLTVIGMDWSPEELIATAAVLLGLTIGAVSYGKRRVWRQRGTRILVFADGLVHVRKQESVRYLWEDIQTYYASGVMRDAGLYVELDWRYHLAHDNGHCFEFSEHFTSKQAKPLGSYIDAGLIQSQLPGLRVRFFENHETLHFGELALEHEGLRYNGKLLPWSEVGYVWGEDGKIRVRRRGKTFNWCNIDSWDVPNNCLFIALAKDRVEREEANLR